MKYKLYGKVVHHLPLNLQNSNLFKVVHLEAKLKTAYYIHNNVLDYPNINKR